MTFEEIGEEIAIKVGWRNFTTLCVDCFNVLKLHVKANGKLNHCPRRCPSFFDNWISADQRRSDKRQNMPDFRRAVHSGSSN
jgi:hypothetical protein